MKLKNTFFSVGGALLLTIGFMSPTTVKADEIEEVIVVAQQVRSIETTPVTSTRLISAIMPAFTYSPGGYGGFIGYNERGAQTVHTTVYTNGIPANEPGSGWYNFGHDIVSGESIKVISGANGVLYGSGSIAGTVLIKDVIDSGSTIRFEGSTPSYLRIAPTDNFEYTKFRSDMPSVRNDNTEEDSYDLQQAKVSVDAGDWTFAGKFVEYDYDYDNCYTADFSQSNDCVDTGDRYNVSVRNDNITLGRSFTDSKYSTDGVETYSNESYRNFLRIAEHKDLSSMVSIDFGVDAEALHYATESTSGSNTYEDDNYGAFVSVNASAVFDYNFGVRIGNDDQNALRFGMTQGQFFLNIGNSFRKPTLYEKFGDDFVLGNENLKPEEGIGYEIGFGTLGLFRYEFSETIDYQSGFMLGEVYVNPQYYNAGDFITQGFRYSQNFGAVSVMLKYTDTEQPRVAKYDAMISWKQRYGKNEYQVKYAVNLDRAHSQYDIIDSEFLEDLKKMNLYYTRYINEKVTLSLKVENAFDDVVEVVPFYDNQGREFYLTLGYNW
jgi:outer membrane cobalamin receptor